LHLVVIEVLLKISFADHDPATDVNGAELARLDQSANRKLGDVAKPFGGFGNGY
jgi:hypothetical protein